MKVFLAGCALLATCAMVVPAGAQQKTVCDSPCKLIPLPLVRENDQPVPNSNPLAELQGKVRAANTACDSPCKFLFLPLVPVPTVTRQRMLPFKVDTVPNGVGNPVGATYFEYQVDKPAKVLAENPGPRYPDSLKTARVDGEVVTSFAVDTTGLVDPASLHILRSTHPMFAAAAREAVLRMRFVPAELRGVKVRQFVQQPFVFNIPR